MSRQNPRSWPEGFMWGTGASSTQCEGAAPASDWYDWEQTAHAPLSGMGNDFGTRYSQDFALLAGLGLTHHRLSIEWARIEPNEGERDQLAITHYREILLAAKEAGIHPWVCLHHFSLPRWFARLGGFLIEENRTTYWQRHVEFIAQTFGDLVEGWQPVNETNYYPTAAYLGRGWPPGHNDLDEWRTVSQQIHLATAEAAQQLKQTGAPVASIFGLSTLELLDDEPQTHEFAERFYGMNWNAGLGLHTNGVLRIDGCDPIERPDLANVFDLLGFSYYCAFGVRNGQLAMYPDTQTPSPLGYSIWPNGLLRVLERLHAQVPNTPLLIAEYGIGTANDIERTAYLTAGLDITHAAIQRGINIRGFFHWTAVDNYEWLHGHDLQFGIISRDRAVKPSAQILRVETATSR